MVMDKTFLGRGWAFPPQFNKTSVSMVEAEEDIRQSLYVLLSTTPGERVMQPEYGCGLKLRVFDNITSSAVASIVHVVKQAILFFEPRIIVDKVDVHDEEKLEGKYSLCRAHH